MFFRAFGEEGIDSIKVSKAIAQFLRTVISSTSEFDVMYKYENGMSFSARNSILQGVDVEEWASYDLFKSFKWSRLFSLSQRTTHASCKIQ